MSGLEGKVALITGGARGIGRAICETLGAERCRVVVNYRREEQAAEETAAAVRKAGGEALVVQGDIGEPEDIERLVETTRSALGPVELLVNNAAYSRMLSVDELTPERWSLLFRTNVDAPYRLTWAVKDDMMRAGRGAIVNISSFSGIKMTPEMLAYGTTKAALNAFTRGCSLAFAEHGIRVNAVAPGLVRTPRAETVSDEERAAMTGNIPLGRGADPDEIARVVRFLLSEEASYITGEVITAAGGRH